MKALFNTLGCLALALAVAGIFLPLLPTTPFVLAASACFMRGSSRMHRWLTGNPVLGACLRDYEAGRGIPAGAKAAALLMMWVSLLFAIAVAPGLPAKALLALAGLGVSGYLLFGLETLDRNQAPRDGSPPDRQD